MTVTDDLKLERELEPASQLGPPARPGAEAAVVIAECSAILRGLSEAAEDSRCCLNCHNEARGIGELNTR